MPLIAFLVLGYFAGLLASFGGMGLFVGALAATTTAAALLGSAPRLAVAGAMLFAGCLTGSSASETRRLCVARAANSQAVVVRLRDEVAPGAFSRAKLDCGGEASVFVARGRAAAGARVGATGDISATSDTTAVLIRAATVTVVDAPPWTDRLRSAAGRAVDRDFKGDAPLVRALVLADMRGMSPEIRDRWAAAGMVHMLSVSGLHVGIIAAVVELLLGVMRVSRRSAPVVAIVIIAAYVLIIGAPAPAVRSAVMLGLRAISQLMQRSVSPWAILAIGAAHPIVDPWIVLDLGYQLSVIGVAALIAAAALVKRFPIPDRPRWSKEVVAATTCTIVASIASLPLVAYTMGRVSLIAPVSNLVAGPVIAAVQPMLFLGALLAPVPAAAGFVADAAHPILAAMNGIATMSAMVPGASVTVWPSTGSAVLVGIIAIGVLMACVDKHSLRPLIVAGVASALLAWMPPPRGAAMTELHMIDVGQGDAIALRTTRGRWVLFDAGRVWDGGDAGRRTIVPYIAHRGGRVEAFVLSHPHADHVGGAASVIAALAPRRYVDAGFVTSGEAYRASLVAARRDGVDWVRAQPGDSIVVDEATIVFLAPDSVFAASLPDPNNASTVALIRVGGVRILMMGDAEQEEEAWLLTHAKDWLHADVLKVGHHGSATSSTAAFLDAVRPRIALVSVGMGNMYGHPSAEVMTSLASRGAQIARTDRLGTVIVETDGRIVRVKGR